MTWLWRYWPWRWWWVVHHPFVLYHSHTLILAH